MHFHCGADHLSAQVVLFGIRDHSVHSVNSVGLLWHANHEAHVEEQQRSGEKEAIQQIERSTNSREQIAGVFYAGAALNDGFG